MSTPAKLTLTAIGQAVDDKIKKRSKRKGASAGMDWFLRSIQNPFLGLLYAVLAGILTSTSPCSLAAIPLVIGHMAGIDDRRRKKNLAAFLAGMALSLTFAGMIAGVFGRSLVLTVPWLRPLAGLAFIVTGVAYLGLFTRGKTCKINLPLNGGPEDGQGPQRGGQSPDGPEQMREKPSSGVSKNVASGVMASFSLGVLYGVTASPCATPALLGILSLVVVAGSLWKGAVLLLAYSLGQSVLILIAGLATIKFKDFLSNERNVQFLDIVRKLGGTIVAIFGVYLLIRPYL